MYRQGPGPYPAGRWVTARHPQRRRKKWPREGGAHAGTPGFTALRLPGVNSFQPTDCPLSCSRGKAKSGAEPSPEVRHVPFRLGGFSGAGEPKWNPAFPSSARSKLLSGALGSEAGAEHLRAAVRREATSG